MKQPTVLLHTDRPDPAREIVAAEHPDLTLHTCDSYAALPDMLARTGADVVYTVRFAGTPGFPRQALVEAPSVKWISVGGSGTDHLNPWNPIALTVTNAAGVAAEMMAQYALGAMLHFSLNLPAFQAAKARRDWVAGSVEPLNGRTVLIVGLGHTGKAVARLCKAMGMNTVGVRARPAATESLDEVHHFDALPTLWPRADFVVVAVPLLDTSRGLIDRAAFQAMKETAVLVDVSRGGVVNEAALIDALRSQGIRGAALDVFATEPLPQDSPLWAFDNVLITPHCSSVYPGWDLKSVEMFSDNLGRYRRSESLVNIVDPARGY